MESTTDEGMNMAVVCVSFCWLCLIVLSGSRFNTKKELLKRMGFCLNDKFPLSIVFFSNMCMLQSWGYESQTLLIGGG